MTDRRRRTFDSRDGDAEVVEPLLRAVLSYAPRDESRMPHPSEGITLRAVDGSGFVLLALTIADDLGAGIPGPFGSRFYECGSFEVIVPQRDPRDGALLMIHLLDARAPHRFEFATSMPPQWSLRLERDGSVSVLDDLGDAVIFIGRPWAFDSDLYPVSVHYTIENGLLVQNILATADTGYPILIDPDPDAIITGDGRLITETWTPRLVAGGIVEDLPPKSLSS
ncbi:hypothetical protein O4160_24225 [Rhodococcus sp. IEGM 1401]|uniref:hypothetical protein n=1 Tax=unclassified Rhodococcus (in: high G+C Gram-positive bacteria) TaxID=192944 RepID=UPI0022B2ED70|nr:MULTISPECIES: hypothetical protein [unclassified Rhodococcus (in: high G+C Gram-positive bacteria)]MCZ4563953.1 hypothetical protein [Rhodococcus sp. IEGM 1401]MDI9924063.1 hypothetical protein [Rhodococcus sp. IEGM 1372]MDV8036543.1 hypothetical protein [Rhodococcus sp. IEGM 1414]